MVFDFMSCFCIKWLIFIDGEYHVIIPQKPYSLSWHKGARLLLQKQTYITRSQKKYGAWETQFYGYVRTVLCCNFLNKLWLLAYQIATLWFFTPQLEKIPIHVRDRLLTIIISYLRHMASSMTIYGPHNAYTGCAKYLLD